MEQEGLTAQDMVPHIGSRSKVSEVLSGRRPLSLRMIRNLHSNLGIPSEVLLKEVEDTMSDENQDYEHYPIKEMIERKWIDFKGSLSDAKEQAEELIGAFFQSLNSSRTVQPFMLRQCVRNDSSSDQYALGAWLARIQILAQKQAIAPYQGGSITTDFMKQLVNLSYFNEGPKLAKEFLEKNGIHLIVEKYLRKTQLDGAALILSSGNPVVGLTLLHNRLDNFWFTLCHELAHIKLHLEPGTHVCFLDDLDKQSNSVENEANMFAAESLIPSKVWKNVSVQNMRTNSSVTEFANKMKIHPSIVAGRIRMEQKNYRLFSNLVGQGVPGKIFFSS